MNHLPLALSFSNTLLDELRGTGQVVTAKIRNNALSSLNRLWNKVNMDPSDPRRGKLPDRCNRHWFCQTFLGTLRHNQDASIWDQPLIFHMYDPLALLCCVPSIREKYFTVKKHRANEFAVDHVIIGVSAENCGIVSDEKKQDLSSFIRHLLLQ